MHALEALLAVISLIWLYALILARWERGIYWLIAYMPFSGAVSLGLHMWRPSLLFKDFLFVIPLYIAFFARVAVKRISLAAFPSSVAFLMASLALLAIVQVNNAGVVNTMMGLIGIKVWLFYLPLCLVGYALADSPECIFTLLRLMVALSFIPAVIALLQLVLVAHFGYQSAMDMSYGESAAAVTQHFAQFRVATGSFGRIPSIFTFAAQFFAYSLAMIPPAYILSRTDPSLRWRRTGIAALATAAVATFISGAREAYVFTPLILGLVICLDRGLRGILFALGGASVVVWIAVTAFVGTTLGAMYRVVSALFTHYARSVAYGGLVRALEHAPLGLGTGTNTGAARYAMADPTVFIGIENYYAKASVELGLPGLLVVVGLFMTVIVGGFKARRLNASLPYRSWSNAFLAFAIIIFLNSFKGWLIDLDPLNVYYWLFAGILMRLAVPEHCHSESEDITWRFLVSSDTRS